MFMKDLAWAFCARRKLLEPREPGYSATLASRLAGSKSSSLHGSEPEQRVSGQRNGTRPSRREAAAALPYQIESLLDRPEVRDFCVTWVYGSPITRWAQNQVRSPNSSLGHEPGKVGVIADGGIQFSVRCIELTESSV